MWLLLAVVSYFINAGVYVADKFLLSQKIHSSVAYAFFVGIWSIFNFLILPLDPWLPNLREFGLDMSAGLLFLFTLIVWYKALHQSEATRVVPIVGALVPIFSFMLSYIFLGETLNLQQFLAFVILISGGVLISVKHTRFYIVREALEKLRNIFGDVLGGLHASYRPTRRLIFNSAAAALLFASYYVLIKFIYMTQPFVGAFVWSRLGTFIGAMMILLVPEWRRLIVKQQSGQKSPGNMTFFLSVRFLAALAFIMLNWAIALGNVALVNSLQGVQYLFLLALVILLSSRFPKIMKEELSGGVLAQKIVGASLVTLGLYMLLI